MAVGLLLWPSDSAEPSLRLAAAGPQPVQLPASPDATTEPVEAPEPPQTEPAPAEHTDDSPKKVPTTTQAESPDPEKPDSKVPDPVGKPGKSYLIRSVTSNLCIDLPYYGSVDSGAKVAQYDCQAGDTDNQMFQMLHRGNHFAIKNVKSGLCLDLPDYGTVPAGTAVLTFACDPSTSDNQLFSNDITAGPSPLVHLSSGLCLTQDPKAGIAAQDTALVLAECDADAGRQNWIAE
nr:ricin-type beta-trefoil lectin domain protein [Kineosporia babensis]